MRAVYIFFLLLLCGLCSAANNDRNDRVILRVGLPDNPPLTFRNEQGNPDGFDVELLRVFASENGWQIKYVDGSWEQCLDRLKKGEIDLLSTVVRTPHRQTEIRFSKQPIFIEWGKVFVRFSLSYKSVVDLNNQIIGLVKGDVHAENFKSFIQQFEVECKYKYFDNYRDAMNALRKEEVFAVVASSIEGLKYRYSHRIKSTGIIFGGSPAYYGISRDQNSAILQRLDEQLKAVKANRNSVYYELYKKYLRTDRKPKIPLWLLYAFLGASCAALAFLIISIFLRFQVNRQMNRLWEREEHLKITLDSIGDAVIVTDELGNVMRMNPVAEAYTGWRLEDALGLEVCAVFNIVSTRTGNSIASPVRKVLNTGEAEGLTEHITLVAKNGKRRQIAESAAPIRRGNESVRGVVLVFRDVTKEYNAHKTLEESEARLRLVFDHLPVMVIAYDEDGMLAYWNSECERVVGWSSDELLGLSHEDIFKRVYPGIDYSKHRFADAIKGKVLLSEREWHMRTKNGEIKIVLWYDVFGEAKVPGWSFWSVGVEITPRVELEQQVRQMQKLESIGNLAGGVAHDFNNILQVIRGYTEMIAEAATADTEIKESVDAVLKSVDRGGHLVRQLLYFSSRSGHNPEVINTAELILDLLSMLKSLLGEDIKLELDVTGNIPNVYADPNQLEQCLINLCLNSRQAMPDGGSIKVASRGVAISRTEQTIVGELPAGKYVVIEVADTGKGIEPEVLPRIFDPFFTTRMAEEGSGLGLATVYGVVKRHNGGIIVNSKPGHGSIFTLWLPVTDKPRKIKGQPPETAAESITQEFSKTILLAEDEDEVRDLSEKFLSKAGYVVVSVRNGRDAVSAFKEQPGKFDLLIFDIVMSEMNGTDAYKKIAEAAPGFPVIFVSGYGKSRLEHNGLPKNAVNVLHKPFSRKELLDAVDKVFID